MPLILGQFLVFFMVMVFAAKMYDAIAWYPAISFGGAKGKKEPTAKLTIVA